MRVRWGLAILMVVMVGATAGVLRAQDGHSHADEHHADEHHAYEHSTHGEGTPLPELGAHGDLLGVGVLVPTEGNVTRGVVQFIQTHEGLRVVAHVEGLTPNQLHGFHIHEFGDMRSADGSAQGGHYNPGGHDHGLPDDGPHRHAGDLGNLQANELGIATYDETFEGVTLVGGPMPVVGRGLIVHRDPDDGSQPTGNAGPRIAQGVIGIANPEP